MRDVRSVVIDEVIGIIDCIVDEVRRGVLGRPE